MQTPENEGQKAPFERFGLVVSSYRLNPYISISGDTRKGIAHYLWNVSLSAALYPTISFFEIAFRNALHNALSIYWGRQRHHWGEQASAEPEPDTRWFMDNRLVSERELKEAHEAMQRLNRARKPVYASRPGDLEPVEPDRVIAEFPFGYHVNLYSNRYTATIVGPTVKLVFPGAPKSMRRQGNISPRLQEILALRNRISHHEPIHNDLQLEEKYNRLVEMLEWIEPQQRVILSAVDKFREVYQHGEGWQEFL